MKNAALYIRVSTHGQEELSPDSQKRLLLDYAEKNLFRVEDKWIFQENGISGRKADKRPQFQQMIAAAKSDAHPFDAILVWKFSRFARNQEESIVYKSMLRGKFGVDVISISEPIMEGPFGSLIERIIEWMDEFYSIRLAGDVTRGMTEKALRGGYQGRPPLGYRIPHPGGDLEEVPSEARTVRQIFNWYGISGLSSYSIAQKLNQEGYRTALGNPFEKRGVEYILQNPLYAGYVRWNRTDGQTGAIRDRDCWIIAKGAHPAIVSQELFDLAAARRRKEGKSDETNTCISNPGQKPCELVRHWLGGVLKCPDCGHSLSSCRRRRKTLPDTFSFQCSGYLKGICNRNCYVAENVIVPMVLENLQKTLPEISQAVVSPDYTPSEKNAVLRQKVRGIIYDKDRGKIQIQYTGKISCKLYTQPPFG